MGLVQSPSEFEIKHSLWTVFQKRDVDAVQVLFAQLDRRARQEN